MTPTAIGYDNYRDNFHNMERLTKKKKKEKIRSRIFFDNVCLPFNRTKGNTLRRKFEIRVTDEGKSIFE